MPTLPIKNQIVTRLGIVYMIVLFGGVLIIGKVVYLQIFQRSKWSDQIQTLMNKEMAIPANRGDICARDGQLLATSVPYFEIRLDAKAISLPSSKVYKSLDSLARGLAKVFNDRSAADYRSYDAWKQLLYTARKNSDRYLLVKRNVDYNQLKQLKQLPIFKLGRYKGGFIYNQYSVRKKPFKSLASRTIGRLKNQSETHNTVGIEGAYDNLLKGNDGLQIVQKLAGGVWMPVGSPEVEPEDGKDVITTIDVNLQDVAQNALLKHLKRHRADHGTAVLMEVATGDILAIANLLDTLGTYQEYFNYAIAESAEPGSTFKLASMLVALEDDEIELDDTVHINKGVTSYYGFTVRDAKPDKKDVMTVQEAFELSSNVGISRLIFRAYSNKPQRFVDGLFDLNINVKQNLDILGESEPYIKTTSDPLWSSVSLPQMSIGYEVKVTPLQTLTLYNAIANGGKMVKPRFVKAIAEHGRIIKEYETEVIDSKICSDETLEKVRVMLEGVVERGTAKNLKNSYYGIAGKTGTAQIAKSSQGYRDHNARVTYQASFVGYFPADNPKYSCIVVINSPSKDLYYGNIVAAPVFKEIADRVYSTSSEFFNKTEIDNSTPYPDVPRAKDGLRYDLDQVLEDIDVEVTNGQNISSPWVVTTETNNSIKYSNRSIKKNIVPLVEGMGLMDAIAILENAGLRVNVKGRGKVVHQSLPSGRTIKKGEAITIELGL